MMCIVFIELQLVNLFVPLQNWYPLYFSLHLAQCTPFPCARRWQKNCSAVKQNVTNMRLHSHDLNDTHAILVRLHTLRCFLGIFQAVSLWEHMIFIARLSVFSIGVFGCRKWNKLSPWKHLQIRTWNPSDAYTEMICNITWMRAICPQCHGKKKCMCVLSTWYFCWAVI